MNPFILHQRWIKYPVLPGMMLFTRKEHSKMQTMEFSSVKPRHYISKEFLAIPTKEMIVGNVLMWPCINIKYACEQSQYFVAIHLHYTTGCMRWNYKRELLFHTCVSTHVLSTRILSALSDKGHLWTLNRLVSD